MIFQTRAGRQPHPKSFNVWKHSGASPAWLPCTFSDIRVRQAMEEAGIEDIESRHIVIPWNPEQREKAYEEMLPFFKKQTALFFSSDYYALEASNFLQNRGIKVPEEISIAGFDDVTYATLARPKLTTVHQMVDGKARRAVEVLMHLIQDEPVQKDIPPLPTTLVERESVRDLTK